jgi:hypothetical protein
VSKFLVVEDVASMRNGGGNKEDEAMSVGDHEIMLLPLGAATTKLNFCSSSRLA